MAEVAAFLRGQDLAKLLLHFFRLFTLGKTQPSADADTVGIADYAAGNGIQVAQKQICGFSADTGDPKQFLHSAGNLSTVVAQQHLAAKDDIPSLMLVESAGTDMIFHI